MSQKASPGCEQVNPYGDRREKGEQVREMFDNIAPAYDFMNRAMTLGTDRLWRRRAINELAAKAPERVLDVATGTADLALEIRHRLHPSRGIAGVDLSEGMIAIGRRKVEAAGASADIELRVADCLSLPFADGEMDCVTAAFGVRNFSDLAAGYREMARVTRRGGTLCVLELSTPKGRFVGPLYRFYTRHIIPFVGRMASGDSRAYTYLPESIAAVPQGDEMVSLILANGWFSAHAIPLTYGVCTLYMATK
ncbi:MAG: bifunctional demethylmenaquinone methyltransferase/2-methoxy-6-polyprenyl-1,4-benzoquinol methylase UbiE [Pseudoflavonifractor sp.]|nr:bifunctional demethylmenaquinone methyltransferase/2-methoxy-6-polyprenyl-1,4-benzoquinol methylase UbiE [Alloprevotella sp.]MCM1116451.1 bifunctional demethylmenaquinone methyltransferase/2-methoxy-6-polyprenyl-1,4-benzoquinol methylase UbiE [Pseudoflavonifractor sp.]